jgi:hypothetical protein
MKKYEFYKIDENTIGFKYKDKDFSFMVNVKLQKELQSLIAESRIKLLKDLSSRGESINDYVIVSKKDGKTYYDNSNKAELEKYYQEKATLEYFDNFCTLNFGMDMTSLMEDIGLTTEEEGSEFAKDISAAITGKIPSRK